MNQDTKTKMLLKRSKERVKKEKYGNIFLLLRSEDEIISVVKSLTTSGYDIIKEKLILLSYDEPLRDIIADVRDKLLFYNRVVVVTEKEVRGKIYYDPHLEFFIWPMRFKDGKPALSDGIQLLIGLLRKVRANFPPPPRIRHFLLIQQPSSEKIKRMEIK